MPDGNIIQQHQTSLLCSCLTNKAFYLVKSDIKLLLSIHQSMSICSSLMLWINAGLAARSGFGGCFSGEGGFFCVISGRRWTFLRIFWGKLDLFAFCFGESGLFRVFTACSLGKCWKNWLKIMDLETLWSNYIPFEIVTNKTCPK